MTSVVIGDDHGIFLDALSGLLAQRGFEVTVARTVAETRVRCGSSAACAVRYGLVDDARPDRVASAR